MISRSRLAAVCIRRRFLATAGPVESVIPESEPVDPIEESKPRYARGERTWLKLHGLPRTVSPADVSRHVKSLTGRDPEVVHLDYRNFLSSGRAWVRFDYANKANDALKLLRGSKLAGHELRAQKTDEQNLIDAGQPSRSRGQKGRAEASERGLVDGHGPDAKLKERGTNVYLWGLPGRMFAPELVKLFDSYGLRVTAEETRPIQKIERKSPTSRFLVRLTTVSGAHRLVRDFHMTEKFGAGYLVHAQVVY